MSKSPNRPAPSRVPIPGSLPPNRPAHTPPVERARTVLQPTDPRLSPGTPPRPKR